MPDERPSQPRGPIGKRDPRGDRVSDTPAGMKPMKLPNAPINGFGALRDDDAAGSNSDDTEASTSGGTAAGIPLAPSFEALDAEQREQQTITRLRDLMRVLTRALKAKRMYPANNPLLARILGEASIAMNETLEAVGDLHITVQQFDLLFLGQSIYNNPSKKESLAFRFSKDGITELAFQEGLASEELESFLTVMSHAMESSSLEDDLVTLLWEQEFSHISYAYLAIDDMQENIDLAQLGEEARAELELSFPRPDEDSEIADEASDIPGIEHQHWTAEDGGSGHRADDWNELVPVKNVEVRCSNDFLHLTSQEIEALAEEIHREHSRSLHEVVLEILTEVAEDEQKPEAFADLARALGDLLIVVLQEADLRSAVEIAATLKTLSASRGHDPQGFLPGAQDLVTQAVAALARHPEADPALLPEFLVHLGVRAIDPVCDLLVDVDLHSLHANLQIALVELAKQDLAAIRSRIDLAPPMAARLLVQVLAQVGGPDAEQALAAATSHIEARVRKEAITALATSGNPNARAYMLRALDDDDPQVRAAALFAVHESFGAASESRQLAERLLAVLGGPRFEEQSAVERRAYFDTLAEVGGPTVVATLDAWLGLWRIGGGADLKARRELAARALAQMPAPEARAALKRRARSFVPAVRSASRKALGEMAPDDRLDGPLDGPTGGGPAGGSPNGASDDDPTLNVEAA